MKVLIIEDNELDQLILNKFISEDKDLELVGSFENAIEAISLMRTLNPDLIFLDVELPDMNGLEFLEAIKSVPMIIMVTSHHEFALDAYENDVLDFIPKPIEKTRFEKGLAKAKQMHQWLGIDNQNESNIYVRVERENIKVKLDDILFLEAKGDYVRIVLKDKKLMVLTTMKAIGTKLPPKNFARIHRSYFVNTKHLDAYNAQGAEIREHNFPISRRGLAELKEKLG